MPIHTLDVLLTIFLTFRLTYYFRVRVVRAACFVRGLIVRHANWYGSKGRVSRDGVALNVLGYFTLLARPLANHSMK